LEGRSDGRLRTKAEESPVLNELGLGENCVYTDKTHSRRTCTDACGRSQNFIYANYGGGYHYEKAPPYNDQYEQPCQPFYDYSTENQAWRDLDKPEHDYSQEDFLWHEPEFPNPEQTWREIYSGKQATPPAGYSGCTLYSQRKGTPVYLCPDPKKKGRMKKVRGTLRSLEGLGDMMDELFPTGLFSFGQVNAQVVEGQRRARTVCPKGQRAIGRRCVRYISNASPNRAGGGGGD
jgi:hypothetical protein